MRFSSNFLLHYFIQQAYYVNISSSISTCSWLRIKALFQIRIISLNTTIIEIIGKTYNFLNILGDFSNMQYLCRKNLYSKDKNLSLFFQITFWKSVFIHQTNYPPLFTYPPSQNYSGCTYISLISGARTRFTVNAWTTHTNICNYPVCTPTIQS